MCARGDWQGHTAVIIFQISTPITAKSVLVPCSDPYTTQNTTHVPANLVRTFHRFITDLLRSHRRRLWRWSGQTGVFLVFRTNLYSRQKNV